MIAGILLAAGRSQRFGAPKLLARLPDGRPLALAALESLAAGADRVYAVVRPQDFALGQRLAAAGAQLLPCPYANTGMGASLAWGIRETPEATGWLIFPADMPWVRRETVRQLAAALKQGGSMVAPEYRGRRGHPVGFAREFREELLGLSGDEGARRLLIRHAPQLRLIACDDPGVLIDIDTQEDLARLALTGV